MIKKQLVCAFLCVFILFSCKNDVKKEEETASEKTKQEQPKVEKKPVEKKYKHSLAQWSLHTPFQNGTLDPMNFPQIAKDLGFEGVEYVTQLYPQVEDAVGKPNYKEAILNLAGKWLEKSKAAGVDNVLIMVDHAGELADPDPEKLKIAVENHKIWMDAAKLIGAHSVRANLFGELDPEKWHTLSVASLKELGAYGKEIGVNIVIENHGGWSSDADKLVAVMQEVNMDSVGVLPDFGNFCVERRDGDRWASPCINTYDMYDGVTKLMPFAKGVSAKSYNFDEQGNETKIDYQKMLQIVADAGYKGYIGTEYEGPLEDPKEGVTLTKTLVQKSIDNLN